MKTSTALTLLTFLLLAQPLRAAQYLIDVSGGTDFQSGHELRVTGILDVDVSTDVISSSSLFFHHHTDAPIPLPSMPTHIRPEGGVDFVDENGSLFIAFRSSGVPLGDVVSWSVSDNDASRSLTFHLQSSGGIAGDPYVSFSFGQGPPLQGHGDDAQLGGDGAPIKLGTAVPEPSALMLVLVGAGAAGIVGRKRR